MALSTTRIRTGHGTVSTEGWLMSVLRLLGERLGHPAYLYPDQLSPHLQRDIGLMDGRTPGRSCRS